MKKFTSLSFMLIAALLMFASCSKDDDSAPALDLTLLEGAWTVTKTEFTFAGSEPEIGEGFEGVYTFNVDKTYTFSGVWSDAGTYAVSGNSIFLTADDETTTYNVVELTDTKFTLHRSEESEIAGVPLEYSETIYLSRAK